MTLKRVRDEDVAIEATAAATCLMLLSKVGNSNDQELSTENSSDSDTCLASPGQRVYSCKTCSKRFHSFQALGGHRASHKKIRLVAELMTAPEKVKRHECPLCGLEFPSGQALGGHMRRHRAELEERKDHHKTAPLQSVVLKRSNSSKRVFGLDLDLNLTPYENDLKLGGKMQSTATVSPLFSAFFYLNSTVWVV